RLVDREDYVAFAVRGRGRGDHRDDGAAGGTSHRDHGSATLGGDQEVAFLHARTGEDGGRRAKDTVGAGVRVAGRLAIRVVRRAAAHESGRHEPEALDADVTAC